MFRHVDHRQDRRNDRHKPRHWLRASPLPRTYLTLSLKFVKNPGVLEGRLAELGGLLLELLAAVSYAQTRVVFGEVAPQRGAMEMSYDIAIHRGPPRASTQRRSWKTYIVRLSIPPHL